MGYLKQLEVATELGGLIASGFSGKINGTIPTTNASISFHCKPKRGKFIIFDGIDGSGKGTLIRETSLYLTDRAIKHRITKQPGGSVLGNEIRKILFESVGTSNIAPDALELLFMANHVHNCFEIEQALDAGLVVLADRHWPSALAYMQARGASARMREIYLEFRGLEHDVFFLLHGDPEVLLKRARDRMTETHQTAKKWNDAKSMRETQNEFFRLFGPDSRTYTLQTGTGRSPSQEFEIIRPVIDFTLGGG